LLRHIVRGFDVVILYVDESHGNITVRGNLAQKRQLGQFSICIFEHELIHAQLEHLLEDRFVDTLPQRTARVVPKAKMGGKGRSGHMVRPGARVGNDDIEGGERRPE